MTRMEYWKESLASSFEEHGISATEQQIEAVAKDIQISQECVSLAFHTPLGESSLSIELRKLQDKLRAEKEKVTCKECNGNGILTCYGPVHSSTSSCWKCRGEGRHAPGL